MRAKREEIDVTIEVVPDGAVPSAIPLHRSLHERHRPAAPARGARQPAKGPRIIAKGWEERRQECREARRVGGSRAGARGQRAYLQSIYPGARSREQRSCSRRTKRSCRAIEELSRRTRSSIPRRKSCSRRTRAEHRERRAHARNEELSRVNGDLLNLLGQRASDSGDRRDDLRIRRFTPMGRARAEPDPGDIGRPIGHIKPNIDCRPRRR